jgi:Flp pilus assembly protein TadD
MQSFRSLLQSVHRPPLALRTIAAFLTLAPSNNGLQNRLAQISMRFALHIETSTVLRFSLLAAPFLLLPFVRAQDSANEGMVPRTDRPEISLTVRDHTGEPVATIGNVKLYREGVLANQSPLSRGRAVFGSLPFGSYTLVVDATGYKPAQRDVNLSVAMRYEIDATLQRDSSLGASVGGPAKPLLTPKAKEALDKSLKALSKNKLSEAEKYLAEALRLAPGHPDVLYVQGVLLLNQRNWPLAQSVLERASQMDPTNAAAFSALGMALVDQGKYDEAVGTLEKSLQLDAGTWETHWALGKAYYHRQQYDQALKNSQLALTESNGKAPQIELLVAQALTAVGKYEEAAQILRDFVKHHGDRAETATARRWLDALAKDGKIQSR